MEFQMAAYLKNLAAFYSNNLFLVNKFSASTPPGTPSVSSKSETTPETETKGQHSETPTPTETEQPKV